MLLRVVRRAGRRSSRSLGSRTAVVRVRSGCDNFFVTPRPARAEIEISLLTGPRGCVHVGMLGPIAWTIGKHSGSSPDSRAPLLSSPRRRARGPPAPDGALEIMNLARYDEITLKPCGFLLWSSSAGAYGNGTLPPGDRTSHTVPLYAFQVARWWPRQRRKKSRFAEIISPVYLRVMT